MKISKLEASGIPQTNQKYFHKYTSKEASNDENGPKTSESSRDRKDSLSISKGINDKRSRKKNESSRLKNDTGINSKGISFGKKKEDVNFRGEDARQSYKNIQRHDSLISIPRITQRKNPYLTVKDLSKSKGISLWSIYEAIRTDPSFPLLNLGKKNYRIDPESYDKWLRIRSQRHHLRKHVIFSGDDLLQEIRK